MKIGIVSDTHDNLPAIKRAVAVFNRLKVDRVIHLGDWCSPFVPEFFEGLQCPLEGIFGNNDGDVYRFLSRTYKKKVKLAKNIYEFSFRGKRFVAYHGEDEQITNSLIQSENYDVVLTGHTHESLVKKYGVVLHVNPGTLSHFRSGKINNKFTIAIYDVSSHSAGMVRI